ncbi:MAG: four helix bundle protein [Tidjanibacter sp.]|nr:four helix bundle protein [Tidjanibacter sp.]
MKRFEDLRVWQDAHKMVREVYSLTNAISDWSFKDQIRRAAISVMNNIAEGSVSGSDANFVKFLHIANGSCGEVRSMLYLMVDLFQVDNSKVAVIRNDCERIAANIHSLITYLTDGKTK